MKNILKICLLFAMALQLFSCKNDDDTTATYIIPYAEQKVTDENAINTYLETHYYDDVSKEIKDLIPGKTALKVGDDLDVNLEHKDVYISSLDLTYKLYYIKINEGSSSGKQPCALDSTFVSYTGTLLDGTVFDKAPEQSPLWFSLDDVKLIRGWSEIIPFFKSGDATLGSNGIVNYTNFGDGIMILPSAFCYYSNSQGVIPAYSPLIFHIKLMKVNHKDHDRDKVLTKDEILYDNATGIITYLDTDGDLTYDYADVDDDGDGFLTKTEVKYTDVNGDIKYYEFANIPMCSGGTKKRHLDSTCH